LLFLKILKITDGDKIISEQHSNNDSKV